MGISSTQYRGSSRHRDSPSNGGPPVAPFELVPSKEVRTITQANIGVGVVVVKYGPQAGVSEDTPTIVSYDTLRARKKEENSLSTRSVHGSVGLKENAASSSQAVRAVLVNEAACSAGAPAHHNLVLCSSSRLACVVSAADALAPGEVVVSGVVVDEAALARVGTGRVILDLVS